MREGRMSRTAVVVLDGARGACPWGDLIVQGDAPVVKFRVPKFAIFYLLGWKIFKVTTA